MRVAINGFGRIGRLFLRATLEGPMDGIRVVAANDLGETATVVHLFRYDSNYGPLPFDISLNGTRLSVGGQEIELFSTPSPRSLPWRDLGVDLVIESSGRFLSPARASQHLVAGARRVILSAPPQSKGYRTLARAFLESVRGGSLLPLAVRKVPMIVMGVNEEEAITRHTRIVSASSCTGNCLAPLVKVFSDTFGIEVGCATAIHGFTNDNRLLDAVHGDLRRARAAGSSILPSVSRAGADLTAIVPGFASTITTHMLRVPLPTVSMLDFTAVLGRSVAKDEVLTALKGAASGRMENVLAVTEEPLVSVDFKKNPYSCVVDGTLVVVHGNMVKVCAWYDNEWAYACRLVDLAQYIRQTFGDSR
jgi:glyceraldehyde 3-phosphate dehydrogenase